jgi:hypothetical protein
VFVPGLSRVDYTGDIQRARNKAHSSLNFSLASDRDRSLQAGKFSSNAQIEHELLKRWNKLPVEDRNKYENEAIDDDIFHQIAYARVEHDRCASIRKELEAQWNNLPDEERIVHKRVITNRDIERRRLL